MQILELKEVQLRFLSEQLEYRPLIIEVQVDGLQVPQQGVLLHAHQFCILGAIPHNLKQPLHGELINEFQFVQIYSYNLLWNHSTS